MTDAPRDANPIRSVFAPGDSGHIHHARHAPRSTSANTSSAGGRKPSQRDGQSSTALMGLPERLIRDRRSWPTLGWSSRRTSLHTLPTAWRPISRGVSQTAFARSPTRTPTPPRAPGPRCRAQLVSSPLERLDKEIKTPARHGESSNAGAASGTRWRDLDRHPPRVDRRRPPLPLRGVHGTTQHNDGYL